jgi:hypothetical protein
VLKNYNLMAGDICWVLSNSKSWRNDNNYGYSYIDNYRHKMSIICALATMIIYGVWCVDIAVSLHIQYIYEYGWMVSFKFYRGVFFFCGFLACLGLV